MAQSKLPGYQVEIRNNTRGVFVVGDMPEMFSFNVISAYESRDQAVQAGDMAGALGQAANAYLGWGAQFKSLSHAVWRGTSPLDISLSLIFDAETNAMQDVHEKIVDLTSLAFPSGSGDVLWPPIPTIMNPEGNRTSIRIGRQFYFHSVVLYSATPMTETRLNNGMPIAGGVDLSFRTITTLSQQDFLAAASMFGANMSGYSTNRSGR